MQTDLAGIGLTVIKRAIDVMRGDRSDSLIDATQVARVEPIVLIDTRLMYVAEMSDLMQCLQSIFSGYYLQAVALSTNVGRVNVMKQLDKLNPRRIPGASSSDWMLSMESLDCKLPSPNDKIALEDLEDVIGEKLNSITTGTTTSGINKNSVAQVSDLANLSVGKLIEVEIENDGKKATVPVSIRLMASSIAPDNLVHILSHSSKDITTSERRHGWKEGRLSYWRDLFLCEDLIDAHRKKLIVAQDSVYSEIISRSRKNQMAAITSGDMSVATASNMCILDSATVVDLELNINGKLSDFHTREKIFKDTMMMIMVVVDREYERVKIYHRSIERGSDLSFRDIKMSAKGGGPDISDVLKAYQIGSSPSF